MVFKLTHDEVMKVCDSCNHFVKDREVCREELGEPRSLKERHRCKKWDAYFGGSCIYQG